MKPSAIEKPVMPISPAVQALAIPHLSDYFGVWMMEEQSLKSVVGAVTGMNLQAHVLETQSAQVSEAVAAEVGYRVEGGIAVMSLRGPLMKFRSSLSDGTGTVKARQAMRAAAESTDVSGIMLVIDSPGGTSAGTQALAADIRAAAKKKPVYAYIEDIGASAAYWLAAMGTKVLAGPTALVGSIGTFTVLYDVTAQAKELGIKVHVVKAGEFKGMGVPGTEITTAQLEEVQRVVNAMNDLFVAEIAAGRNFSPEKARELSDGRVHVGAAAKKLGLIDGVSSYEEAFAMLRRDIQAGGLPAAKPSKEKSMSQETDKTPTQTPAAPPAPRAATIAELKAAIPTSTAEFREQCLESGLTAEQATKMWAGQQAATEAAKKAEKDRADRAEAEAAKAKNGAEPLAMTGDAKPGSGTTGGGSAKAEWDEKIAQTMANRKMERHEATQVVARENPDLRAKMLDEVNKEARRPCNV